MYKELLAELNLISEAYNKVEDIAQDLKNLMEIQCADGNWDYDEYMMGMANGLILADSLLIKYEGGLIPYDRPEPKFKSKPKKGYVVDRHEKHTVSKVAPEPSN